MCVGRRRDQGRGRDMVPCRLPWPTPPACRAVVSRRCPAGACSVDIGPICCRSGRTSPAGSSTSMRRGSAPSPTTPTTGSMSAHDDDADSCRPPGVQLPLAAPSRRRPSLALVSRRPPIPPDPHGGTPRQPCRMPQPVDGPAGASDCSAPPGPPVPGRGRRPCAARALSHRRSCGRSADHVAAQRAGTPCQYPAAAAPQTCAVSSSIRSTGVRCATRA